MRPHGQTKLRFLPSSDSRGQAIKELAELSRAIFSTRSVRRRWRGFYAFARRNAGPTLRD